MSVPAEPDRVAGEKEQEEVAFSGLTTRRVRLLSVERFPQPDGRIRVTVTLEWAGTKHVGDATDLGGTPQLRASALATLEALRSVLGGEPPARFIGVKQFRAFDTEIVVVALSRPGRGAPLVGAVAGGDEITQAAARATLQSLNRLLGNFLAVD